MTAEEIEPLFRTSNRLIRETDCSFHRYLAKEIDWSEPLVCMMGARGAGKTTLMLQHVKETFGEGSDKAIYMSLDNLWFAGNSPLEAVEYLYSHGFTHVFLDEVHHIGKLWSLLLKNLTDQFPSMNFAYSGSSMLKLDKGKGDLSRRQSTYRLKGLSFREYLEFEGVGRFDVLELGQILEDHVSLASHICADIKILPYFDKYRVSGFYPFYKRSPTHYLDQLLETVHKVLDVDYPSIDDVSQ